MKIFAEMNYTKPILLLAFSVLSILPVTMAQNNILSPSEEAEGWKLLFDGTTTDGWRGFNMTGMPSGWNVEDGCLVTTPGDGNETSSDIITIDEYEDIELYLEWAVSPGGNSGIFFHVVEGDYPSTYATGPEYQLIDDAGFDFPLEEWQRSGANYAMHPADKSRKKLMPVGEFNSSRIKVSNGHVTHWLNDEIIVEYDLWTKEWRRLKNEGKWKDYPDYGFAKKGHIGLQHHGSIVRFRNLKLKIEN
jgi:hypothetical protein